MAKSIYKSLCVTPANNLTQSLLFTIMAFMGIANVHAQESAWDTFVVDSVVVNDNTLIVEKSIDSSNGHYFYEYYVKEIEEKCDSIERNNLEFGCGDNSPLWRNYLLFKEEAGEHINYIHNLFDNEISGLDMNGLHVRVRVLINEDGMSFCRKIHTKVKLTDYFSVSVLIQKICEIGTFRYTSPIVWEPEHGWIEFDYD